MRNSEQSASRHSQWWVPQIRAVLLYLSFAKEFKGIFTTEFRKSHIFGMLEVSTRAWPAVLIYNTRAAENCHIVYRFQLKK